MSAEVAGESAVELVTFRAGNQDYGVDAINVRAVRSWSVASALPESPGYICGVFNLRGTVLPIMDFAARLGLEPTEPSNRHVIIAIELLGKTTGLLVDGVSDIISVTRDRLQINQNIDREYSSSLVDALVNVKDRRISVISINDLLRVRPTLLH